MVTTTNEICSRTSVTQIFRRPFHSHLGYELCSLLKTLQWFVYNCKSGYLPMFIFMSKATIAIFTVLSHNQLCVYLSFHVFFNISPVYCFCVCFVSTLQTDVSFLYIELFSIVFQTISTHVNGQHQPESYVDSIIYCGVLS